MRVHLHAQGPEGGKAGVVDVEYVGPETDPEKIAEDLQRTLLGLGTVRLLPKGG
jgi:hypothetical protein